MKLELHPTVAAALAAESPEQAIARDPGLQTFSGQSDEIVRSVARQRVQRGFALPPGVAAPRAVKPAVAAPAPRKPAPPKRREPTLEEQVIQLAADCRAHETPLLDLETVHDLQGRFPQLQLDFRSRSERRQEAQRGAELDRLMGLAPAAEQGVHFDPVSNVQTFGAPAPRADVRPARIGDEPPAPLRDVVQRLDLPVVDETPRTRIGVRIEGNVQSFGVPVPAEPESEPRAPRLSPAVLAAASADDRVMRKVGGKWVP